MPPKSKVNKVVATVVKKRGRMAKRKSIPPNPPADSESVLGDEEEQSMREMMKNMGAMLHTLNARMGMIEKAASSHIVYMAVPDVCAHTDDRPGHCPAHTNCSHDAHPAP